MQAVETQQSVADQRPVPVQPIPSPPQLSPPWAPIARQTLRRALADSLADAVANRRLFVLLPFAMVAGLVAYAQVPVEPEPWALGAAAVAIFVTLILLWNTNRRSGVGLLAAFWLGVCLLPLHGLWFGTPMLPRPAYGLFEAQVDEIVSANSDAQRVVVSGLLPLAGDRPVDIKRARLVVPPEPGLAQGDTIHAMLRLTPVPGPILPGAFDSQFHAYFAGVGAYGTVTGDFRRVASGTGLDPGRTIESLRMAIGARIDAVLDGSSAAIGRAMVVGDQSAIDDETRDVMAAAGLAHVYSISGLHLSIVAGGVFWLLRLLMASLPGVATRWPVKRLAAAAGITAAAFYLLLAGGLANVPALRSTIMLALIFGAVLAGRQALTMRNVAIAAIAIILIDPASVFRASFQLSFAAVVGLIGIYEMPRRTREGERLWYDRLWATIWATAVTSFIAGSATWLFSAYHFQQTAPLGVLGNVLVLPVVSVIVMPCAVLSVLAMPFGLEAPFVAAMGWGIDRMLDCAVLVAGWSQGWTGNPLLTGVALLIGFTALAWFAFVKNWWRLLGPAIALPLILTVGFDARPDLLIADTTQAIALRGSTGLGLVTGRPGSFAVDVWSEHHQEPIADTLPEMRCDSLGCIATTPRFSIAVVKNAAAFAEDCGRHDLLIARSTVPATCRNAQIIDAGDLAAGGVHWLRWDETAARFEIRTAIPNLSRPWRVLLP